MFLLRRFVRKNNRASLGTLYFLAEQKDGKWFAKITSLVVSNNPSFDTRQFETNHLKRILQFVFFGPSREVLPMTTTLYLRVLILDEVL